MEQNRFEIESKRMRPALLRMAIRYLENSDEAEDAVQDALLKLWFLMVDILTWVLGND